MSGKQGPNDHVEVSVGPVGVKVGSVGQVISNVVSTVGVAVGNTVGAFISWKCPKCKVSSKIAQYGGNLMSGGICPACKQNING